MRSERPCAAQEARARLEKAQSFFEVAEAASGSNDDPATSNAVLAGIAAADAVCCHRLGRRSASEDHTDALALLREADPALEPLLRRLLSSKHKAQYDARPVPAGEAEQAVKRARRLVNAAKRHLAS